MSNEIFYDPTMQEGLLAVYVFLLVILAVAGIVQLVLYIFRSLALYKLASRRQLGNAWLAWVPVGWYWIAGSLSDQYQLRVNHKKRYNRVILLALNLVSWLSGSSLGIVSVLSELNLIVNPLSYLGLPLAIQAFFGVLTPVVSIACLVFWVLAFYDVYRSCDAANGLLYTILGTIFGFLNPFFLFACRNKDEGMPGSCCRPASNTAYYKGPEL